MFFNGAVDLESLIIDHKSAINFNNKQPKLRSIVKHVYKNTFILDEIAQNLKYEKRGVKPIDSILVKRRSSGKKKHHKPKKTVIEVLDFEKIKRDKGKRKIKETYNRD